MLTFNVRVLGWPVYQISVCAEILAMAQPTPSINVQNPWQISMLHCFSGGRNILL